MDRKDRSNSQQKPDASDTAQPQPSRATGLSAQGLRPTGLRESRSETAQRILRNRRMRSEHFTDSDLFGEPAWDVLLHLFQGHSNGRGLKIEIVTIASGLPTTSALRLFEVLEGKGLVFAYRDEDNAKQIYLRLSSRGLLEMGQYMDRIAIS